MKFIFRIAVFLAVMAMGTGVVYAQDTTTTTTTDSGTSFSVSAESGYNAVYRPSDQSWFSAAYIKEAVKLASFGKNKQHILSLLGRQDIITGLGYTIYSGGANFQPDISGWLNTHTAIPGDRVQFYVEAEAGNAIDTSATTSVNHVAQRYGFGIPVKIKAATWTPVTASYLRVGSISYAEVSTNIKIVLSK
jgi:hypothetical protein